MILEKFRTGWQERFEAKLQDLVTHYPDLMLVQADRFKGMLRVKFQIEDVNAQYVANAVSFKIERDSAVVCEICGNSGARRTHYLPEQMCLCWKCYALEVDTILSNKKEEE